jgi:hypothetical protein
LLQTQQNRDEITAQKEEYRNPQTSWSKAVKPGVRGKYQKESDASYAIERWNVKYNIRPT